MFETQEKNGKKERDLRVLDLNLISDKTSEQKKKESNGINDWNIYFIGSKEKEIRGWSSKSQKTTPETFSLTYRKTRKGKTKMDIMCKEREEKHPEIVDLTEPEV